MYGHEQAFPHQVLSGVPHQVRSPALPSPLPSEVCREGFRAAAHRLHHHRGRSLTLRLVSTASKCKSCSVPCEFPKVLKPSHVVHGRKKSPFPCVSQLSPGTAVGLPGPQ